MTKIHLEIVTPERAILKEEVDEVVVPGLLGEFGVLPGHTTYLTELGQGRLTYTKGTESKTLNLTGGVAEVCGDRVVVLADSVGD